MNFNPFSNAGHYANGLEQGLAASGSSGEAAFFFLVGAVFKKVG